MNCIQFRRMDRERKEKAVEIEIVSTGKGGRFRILLHLAIFFTLQRIILILLR